MTDVLKIPEGDSMNLEELKRRYEQRNVNYMAEADFMEAVSIQFPAIVAKLEAAQRLRDALDGQADGIADAIDAFDAVVKK